MAIRHLLPCTETQASHLFEKTMQEEGLPPPSPATTPPTKQEMSCIVSERKGGIKPVAVFLPRRYLPYLAVSKYVKLILLERTVSLLRKLSPLQKWEWTTHS